MHTTILQLKMIESYFFILLKINCFVAKLYNLEIKERLKSNWKLYKDCIALKQDSKYIIGLIEV